MADRPNILLMMSDQHSPHVLGCYGDTVVRTPHMDALAASGAVFESNYCQSPLCVPSRMSFLTSRQCSDVRVWTNECVLPSAEPTFAHALGAAGYETALIGRMHFVGPDQWHGFERRLVGSITAVHLGGRNQGVPATGQSRGAVTTAGPGRTAYQVYDEVVAQATADYLEEKAKEKGRPFCAVAGFVLPHCPFVCPREDWDYYYDRITLPRVPEGYFEDLHPAVKLWRKNRGILDLTDEEIRCARAGYYGLVTHFDRQVGVVMDALKRTGLDRNTVVIYCSDHGEMAGEHGMWWKSNLYEGSVSVPLIVSCPERFASGRRVNQVTGLIDLAPTLTELAGADPVPGATGTSLVPLLRGEDVDWANETFSEHYPARGVPPTRMIRRGRWKLVHYEGYSPQLFDVENDPGEFNDLGESPDHAQVRDELQERVLSDWSAQEMEEELARRRLHHPLLREWYKVVHPPDREQWIGPEESRFCLDE